MDSFSNTLKMLNKIKHILRKIIIEKKSLIIVVKEYDDICCQYLPQTSSECQHFRHVKNVGVQYQPLRELRFLTIGLMLISIGFKTSNHHMTII